MKTLFITILFSSFIISICPAQDPTIAMVREWAAYAGNTIDSTFKTPIYSDANYTYIATVVVNQGNPDIHVVKYNKDGIEQYKFDWSGSGNGRDQLSDITVDTNGFVYACGTTYLSSSNNYDFLTLKIDTDGTLLWANTYNGSASLYDVATSITLINDTELAVTGISNNIGTILDYHTIKYNINGTFLWQHDFDYASLMDIPFDIIWDKDDSTIVVTGGSQSSFTDWDYQTIKYTGAGQLNYQGRVSGGAAGFDRAQAMATDDKGYIYVTGATYDNSFDIKTVKIVDGYVAWVNTYNSGGDDIANDIIVDHEDNAYVCGTGKGTNQDFLVAKLEHVAGNVEWSVVIDGSSSDDTARAMCFDSWGNVVVTGQAMNPVTSNYDFFTAAFDIAGNEIWRDFFDGPGHGDDNATDISSDTSGNIYVSGQVWMGDSMQAVTIKYRTDYFINPPAVDTPSTAYLFYPNEGQIVDLNDSDVTDSVHYYTIHHSPQLYFGFGVMNMVFCHIDADTATTDTLQRVDVTFLNSTNPTEAGHANEDTSGYVNYFLAQCPNGITDVHGYGSLIYSDVWPGIDVIYSSNNAGLKLTFVCNPGSNPQEIGLAFNGQDGLSVDQNWYLKLQTQLGEYNFEKPRIYQLDESNNRINLNWQLNWDVANGEAIFTGWDNYDIEKSLIIEIGNSPQYFSVSAQNLIWSTFFGGENAEQSAQITNDNKYVYIIGTTISNPFPPISTIPSLYYYQGQNDVIVSELDPDGISGSGTNVNWATYYGGAENDYGNGIAVNNNDGSIFLTGTTTSVAFPNTYSTYTGNFCYSHLNQNQNNTQSDAFLVHLNNGGTNILYSSYIGGEENEIGRTITIDQSNNNVYIAGSSVSFSTTNTPFPLIPPPTANTHAYYQNVYGGNSGSGNNGDGFIMCFSDDNCLWSTYFGGNGFDEIDGITVLSNDEIIISGLTLSNHASTVSSTGIPCPANNNYEFPVCDPGGSRYFDDSFNTSTLSNFDFDLFLAGFNSSFDLLWSTYYGGTGNDEIAGFGNSLSGTDPISETFSFVGRTRSSTDFPTTTQVLNEYIQDFAGIDEDAFIAKFNEFDRTWCTFFGGDGADIANSACFDPFGNLYVTGATLSSTPLQHTCTPPTGTDLGKFPLCDQISYFYYYPGFNGQVDGFIAGFDAGNSLIWSSYIGGENNENAQGSSIVYIDDKLITYGNTNSPVDINNPANHPYPQVLKTDYYWQNLKLNNLSTQQSFINDDMYLSMFDISLVTNINDISSFSTELTIYPNPSSSTINIKINLPQYNISNKLEIKICDILGKIIYTSKIIKTNENKIDITNLSDGLYFVNITSNNGLNINSKFIKQ